jgi:hypothetical protein
LQELFDVLRSRSALGGPLPWALARFELGCEHPVALEGLSDYLLSLRALLDHGERAEGWIARRLAALCAEPADQDAVEEGVERAFRLERLVMRGDADAAFMAAIGIESPDTVVTELEEHLRALLRDMVCGHIDLDAKRVADELLPDPEPVGEVEAPDELAVDAPEPNFVVKRAPQITASAEEQATEESDWGFLDDDAADYSAAV